MSIPTKATQLGPGSEASLVQLIITWATRQIRPVLHTYASNEYDEQLQELVRRQYGAVAALLCASAKARSPSVDVTRALKAAALASLHRRLLDALSRDRIYEHGFVVEAKRSARGRGAELLCVDHIDPGAIPPFYYVDAHGYRRLRDLRGFTQLTNRIFERLVPSYYKRNFSHEFRNAIGAFAFELVSNTHDHARTNLDGQELLLSVRGLYARHYDMARANYLTMAEGFSPLLEYFKRVLPAQSVSREQLIELSVFDSGPGMAQRWTGRALADLPPEAELEAVQECFFEGTTTKLHRMFGAGLPLVLTLLAAHNGLIRVRTGRISLYLEPGLAHTGKGPTFSQWCFPSPKALAPVAGTLISLLVPVPRAPT